MDWDLRTLIQNGTLEIEQPRVLDFSEAPGLFVKTILIPKRESLVPQHSHRSGHLTMLAVGEMVVWRGGVESGRYVAPAGIVIAPGVKHSFLTLTDNVLIYCIHRLDEGEQEPDVVETHEFDKARA